MDNSRVISKLLQPSSSSVKGGSLIVDLEPSPVEEVDPKETLPTATKANSAASDEPTMFELMMAAQREAAGEKKVEEIKEKKVQETTFANGFKKGFFGNSKPKAANTNSSKAVDSGKKAQTDFDDDIIDLTGVVNTSAASSNKSSNKKVNLDMKAGNAKGAAKDENKFVFDDVQKALEEDQHPLLQKINQNGE